MVLYSVLWIYFYFEWKNKNLLKIEIYKNWVIMYVDDLVVNEIISIEIKLFIWNELKNSFDYNRMK